MTTDDMPGRTGAGPTDRALRVVVADDHPIWRDAVARDLEEAGLDVVATAADGRAAVDRTLAVAPDVLVLDLNLPVLHGVEVARRVHEDLPSVRILVLSASGEADDVLQAVKEGATGYLVKSAGREEFLDAVRSVADGCAVFTPGLAGLVLGEFRRMAGASPEEDDPQAPRLTPRETEILRFVATGMSYREIADMLVVSHRTVQNHVQNILGKLQLHNRVQLARYAVAHGLVDPSTDL
ncbi:response regulator [Mobilicoccus pelagius]|uniref:Putative two-component response regulator n=1 Tax=Mobilicoccus pelagius NBRC 104925 TaxID=1089455 RepID=H5UUS2_9MICO|nr:response regulator transcription factor [Mobilicoccus pelagius]GAB49480.1 putative two-component response regulator [Mobilicoccus pelagius NBRC 104925]